ncbi:MAG TPA: hypothetical protein VIX89_13840, partial [Bryobacteraceae bacterium]
MSGLGMLMLALVCCLDTASAQTLTASPSSITFNTPSGVTPPSQMLTISSTSTTPLVLTTFSAGNWLQATPTTGNTPLNVIVSVGPNAPTSGNNAAFINVANSNAPGTVLLQINVNLIIGGTPGALSVNVNPVNFSLAPGSQVPAAQSVVVTGATGVTGFTTSAMTTDGRPWLSVSDPGNGVLTGTPPTDTISVIVSPTQLPATAGPFSGTVTLTPNGGGQATVIQVNVTISATPALTATPSSLSFAYQAATNPQPAAQTLNIATSTGAAVSFNASATTTTCGNGWLVVSQQNGTTPGALTVSVNTTGLPFTTCQGQVNITAPGVSNSPLVVPVSLLISNFPLLQVPTPGPTFTYQLNSGPAGLPASQNVTITASGSSVVNFNVTANPVGGAPNFLQVSPISGTTPQQLTLTAIPLVVQSLGPGTYVENVQLSSTGAGNSPIFPVTLVVTNTAGLTTSTPSLTFNYQIGQTAPTAQTFTVNSTSGPQNFSVAVTGVSASCPGFLSATVNNGQTTGLTFGGQNQVTVAVNVAGLTGTPATCTGTLTFTVPGSTASAMVPVTLNVSTNPLLNASVPSINVTALAGAAPTTQTIAVTSTGAALGFSAIAATNPAGLTWLSVTPNIATTPNNLLVTINPGTLAVGSYAGSITLASTTNPASFPQQIIPVTLIIASTNIGLTPTSLTFNQPLGSAAPPSQNLQVTGVPVGTTIGAVTTLFNGTAWLTATVANNVVNVTANGSALTQGTYNGVVTIIVPGAGNSPFNVPVTLVVGAPQSLVLSTSTVNFSYQVGG